MLAMVLTATFLFPIMAMALEAEQAERVKPSAPMKGIWVASVLNIDYPSAPTTDPEVLKAEALHILNTAVEADLNAVFLQVRPTSDAFYPSQYFPWSRYLTGVQGVAPRDGFDPLEFWVTEAHRRGLELHAWLNPYRITRKSAEEPPHDVASLDPSHPAIQNPEWVVYHSDGNLYYDPGLPEVRQLLIESSMELIQNYAVDGIHFDDYFYPGINFNDHHTFDRYGQGFASIEDWRRENVNTLIRDLYHAIKVHPREVSFGISPFGIWANDSVHPMGSATRGNQTYYSHYADPLAWIREGTIDYIAPQLYWYIGFEIADYSILLDWWSRVVAGSDVDLYIGQAAYRTGNADSGSPWHGVSEIERQLEMNHRYSEVKGSIFFNYSALNRSPELQRVLQRWNGWDFEKIDPVVIENEDWSHQSRGGQRSLQVSIYVNDVPLIIPAHQPNAFINRDGRTMLPVRYVSEALGAAVDWNSNTETVTIFGNETHVTLVPGQRQALVNNRTIDLDTAADIVQGRTFVPLRFVSEALGVEVDWIQDTQQVHLKTGVEVSRREIE